MMTPKSFWSDSFQRTVSVWDTLWQMHGPQLLVKSMKTTVGHFFKLKFPLEVLSCCMTHFFFFCFQEREIRGFLFLEKQFFLPGLVGNAHYVDTVYKYIVIFMVT